MLTLTESDITGVKSGDVVALKVGDSFDYRGHKGIIIKEYPQDKFDKKANYKLYRVEINGKERDLSLEDIQRKYPKGKNIESGTPLIDKNNPNSRVWYNGVIFQTDGTPKVVVDYVFNDRGKMMQDEMYIDYEAFDERFTPIKSENAVKKAKKEIKEFTDSLPVSLGGLTESEKKEKAKKINEITDKYKVKSKQEITPTEEKKITKATSIKPKNLKDVYKAGREIFGLNRSQALAQAIIVNTVVNKVAKNRGVTPEKVWSEIEFRKGLSNDAQVLYQAVWHGSPYEFDKFRLDKIGTGEGAQAYGWGLYFTDVSDIARDTTLAIS